MNPLKNFIRKNSKDTDIFCLQEVTVIKKPGVYYDEFSANLLPELSAILVDFNLVFYPLLDERDFKYGLAIFLRKGTEINFSGGLIFNSRGNVNHLISSKGFQFLQATFKKRKIWICTLHGISKPGSKLDTAERIDQSKKIVEFLKSKKGEKILAGDFNLAPQTQCIAMVERVEMRNLIKEFNIKDTRGAINHASYPTPQYYSDYAFVSNEIRVIDFRVPQVKVSDHLPLILEFE